MIVFVGSGIREGGGQDGVPVGVPTEDGASCEDHPHIVTATQRHVILFYTFHSLGTSLKIVTFHFQVLMFAEKKADVDAIHEYLLLKGVEAVAIHGGKGKLVLLM